MVLSVGIRSCIWGNYQHSLCIENAQFIYFYNTSKYCYVLKLIFSENDTYKVFQVNYMTAILLDFLPEIESK